MSVPLYHSPRATLRLTQLTPPLRNRTICETLKKRQALLERKEVLAKKMNVILKARVPGLLQYDLTLTLREKLRTARGARSAESMEQRKWLGLADHEHEEDLTADAHAAAGEGVDDDAAEEHEQHHEGGGGASSQPRKQGKKQKRFPQGE